jgi:hypothetical protein
MHGERQIDVDERVGACEALPCERRAAVAVDDPFVLSQEVGVRRE